jgi:DNA-binding MarR family transcriptional regulator
MNARNHALPQGREPCVCTTLRGLARHVTAIYDDALLPTGLKLTQYGVLAKLDRLVHCSLGELSKACELDVTSLSRGIRPLVRAGIVRVGKGRDDRTKRYELTPPGKKLLAQAYRRWQKAQARVHVVISNEELRALERLSSDLRAL